MSSHKYTISFSDLEDTNEKLKNLDLHVKAFKITNGLNSIPTFQIEYTNNIFYGIDLQNYTFNINYIENKENYVNKCTILTKNKTTIAGVIVSPTAYYDRVSAELDESLIKSVQQLDIRQTVNITDKVHENMPYYLLNETRVEGLRRFLSGLLNTTWYLSCKDTIEEVSLDYSTKEEVGNVLSKNIISNTSYSKISTTNFSIDDSVYDFEQNFGTNIRYGKIILPISKIASNYIDISEKYANIINKYHNYINFVDVIGFTSQNPEDNYKLGDIVSIVYQDGNTAKYMIWNIVEDYLYTTGSSIFTYMCRRIINDDVYRKSNKDT